MHTTHLHRTWLAALGFTLTACGAEPPTVVEAPAPTAGAERVEPREEPMQVEGLKGTLNKLDVERGLEPRLLKFATCPGKSTDVELVAGEMYFHFTVAPDGKVADVYGTRSSLGDLATEQCMLGVARGAKFRKPRGGGEAEFDWSLEIPEGDTVRPATPWPEADVASVIEESGGADLLESCGGAPVTVTAYIDTDGSVMTAGAVNGQPGSDEALACVIAGVTGWTFPQPGSYPAKVTFSLP